MQQFSSNCSGTAVSPACIVPQTTVVPLSYYCACY